MLGVNVHAVHCRERRGAPSSWRHRLPAALACALVTLVTMLAALAAPSGAGAVTISEPREPGRYEAPSGPQQLQSRAASPEHAQRVLSRSVRSHGDGIGWLALLPQLMPVLLIFAIGFALTRPLGLPSMSLVQHSQYNTGRIPPPALTPKEAGDPPAADPEQVAIRPSAEADYFGRVRQAKDSQQPSPR